MPKSVNRTLDILEAVCAADGPLDLHEISRLANLPNSTTHRLLQTLVERGYTRRISDSHQYRAGLKVFELSRAIVGNMPLLEAARRPLNLLAERVQETVHLAVLDSNEVLYLHKVDPSRPSAMFSRVGRRAPAYCTGVGKVLLANLLDIDCPGLLASLELKSYTPQTITTCSELAEELSHVRAQGYALDNMEHEEGIHCVACPVFSDTSQVIAAISIAAPVFRVDHTTLLDYLPILRRTALEISCELGYVEPD